MAFKRFTITKPFLPPYRGRRLLTMPRSPQSESRRLPEGPSYWQRSGKSLRRIGWLAWWVVGLTSTLSADDDSLRFVRALRAAGYHETAHDYLEQLAANPPLPSSLASTFDYELAITLLDLASATFTLPERDALWDQADQALDRFVDQSDETLPAALARQARAQLFWDRARGLLEQAAAEKSSSKQSALQAEAQALLDRAAETTTQVKRFYSAALADPERLPRGVSADRDPAAAALIRNYRSGLIEAEILQVRLLKESARTKADGSSAQTQALQEASRQFGGLAEKYRQWTAGLVARLEQARCEQALGNHSQALSYIQEILDQPTNERVFRQLITLAYRHLAESTAALGEQREGLSQCAGWLAEARTEERHQPEWLALKYHAALLARAMMGQVKLTAERSAFQRQALRWATDVRRHPGEFQLAAAELIASIADNRDHSPDSPAAFDAAYQHASDAIENFQLLEAKLAEARAANAADATQAASQAEEAREAAYLAVEQAVTHPQARENAEQLWRLQYWRGYVAYHRKRFHDAALLGDHLANHAQVSTLAHDASKLALAAYLALFQNAPQGHRSYEFDSLTTSAMQIANAHPDSPDGTAAVRLLIDLCRDPHMPPRQSVATLRRVTSWLERLPPGSTQRKLLLLLAGVTRWHICLQQQPAETGAGAVSEEALAEARQMLDHGLALVAADTEVTPALTAASLARVQLELREGNYAAAIAALEHDLWGPLALLDRSTTLGASDDFALRTLEVAVSAYSLSEPPQPERAREMMAALAAKATGAAQRSQLFLRLAVQLQDRQSKLRAAGQVSAADAIMDSLEMSLDELAKQDQGLDWSTRLWIAHTFFTLADGMAKQVPPDETRAMRFQQAAERYQLLLETAAQDGNVVPPNELLGLRLRLASCQRELGELDEALRQLVEVLREKPLMLMAQIEAAATLQQLAAQASTPQQAADSYRQAMLGALPDQQGKNLVWGWKQIAQRTRRHAGLQQEYHRATFDHIASRFGYANAQSDSDEAKKYYLRTWKDIRGMQRIYPELGGPELRTKYDRLLKEVQAALQKQPIGLTEFEQSESTRTSS